MSTITDDDYVDYELTEQEREAREATEVVLDEMSQAFVDDLVSKLMVICDKLSGRPLYPYQQPFARRIFESLIINDGATLTALFSRQSGKSETVANVVATSMIFLPIMAKMFPDLLDHFKHGIWVGAFAPVDDQAENLYSRIVERLTSETALEIMSDPQINERPVGKGKKISLKNGSLVRRQTCHPRATIEGRTYHLILIDECQGAEYVVVDKSVTPMGAATNATMVFTGTPTYTKNVFFKQIQFNKSEQLKRGHRQDHFEADYKDAGKANPLYARKVSKEMLRVGYDSDEFKLSYRLLWLLGKGMFITSDRFDELGDKTMQTVKAWHQSPVVVGIDPARKQDSTIVTVVHVDWDHPDQFGYYPHRVLNWLDLTNVGWEEQYFRIVDFLRNYAVWAVGIDAGGLGDVVAARLKVELPRAGINCDLMELQSDQGTQSKRWKHLGELIERGYITWPAHSKTRALRTYRSFKLEFENLEKDFKGPHVLAHAPDAVNAHDDYCDSLAIACILTQEYTMPTIEVSNNVFYRR